MESKLTILQAFNAMKFFLEENYKKNASDDIGSLLSDLLFLEDGGTADPAVWEDWVESITEISKIKEENNKITILQAFDAMRFFLEKFYGLSDDVISILHDLQLLKDKETKGSAVWEFWLSCVKKAIEKGEYKELLTFMK